MRRGDGLGVDVREAARLEGGRGPRDRARVARRAGEARPRGFEELADGFVGAVRRLRGHDERREVRAHPVRQEGRGAAERRREDGESEKSGPRPLHESLSRSLFSSTCGPGSASSLQVVACGREERGLRDEADDLRPHDGDAVALGLAPHGLEDAVERRLLEVRHVDRDLHLSARLELDPHRLHETVAAREVPDRLRDRVRDREVGRREVDVVGDERRPRAHDDGASGRVWHGRAEVGLPGGILHLLREALELALADVREVLPLGGGRRILVEEDREGETLREGLPESLRERDAFGASRATHGDEGDHVDRPEARVRACV